MSVIENISRLLASDKKRFSQKELAESIGVPHTTVNGWLKNGRDVPADLIIPICGYFGISIESLLTGSSHSDALTTDEQKLIEMYRLLTDQQRADFLGAIRIQLMLAEAADLADRLEGESNALNGTRA